MGDCSSTVATDELGAITFWLGLPVIKTTTVSDNRSSGHMPNGAEGVWGRIVPSCQGVTLRPIIWLQTFSILKEYVWRSRTATVLQKVQLRRPGFRQPIC